MGRAAGAPEAKLILERYRPLRPLGSGGSGSVWLARDERSGREIALKVVPREGNAGTRAEREAATAARLRHERCLRAYTLSRDAEHVYIAYEYVPGRTLRDELRTNKLSDRAVLQIAVQVLEGLAHAHEQGIVHRDVKPSNVLLADGKAISAYLLDFGLALIKEEETLTAVGDVPGTLAYISPERLRGRTATPAADVWAVGVLLWEGLAGRHPFWKSSMLETARAIESGAPSLAKARPDLPKRLTALVDRALAVDPGRRPSAGKLASSLRRMPLRTRRRRSAPSRPSNTVLLAAAAAGMYALYGASALPFYPGGWAIGLALAVAALTALRPRIGLAAALAVPILPLGNIAQGLALLYAAVAGAWFVCAWRRPKEALAFVAGPLLAPLGALGLLPLALERCPGRLRRAALAALGVLTANLASGLAGHALPFTADPAPGKLGVEGADQPAVVARALHRTLTAEPAVIRQALVLAAAAALLPLLRGRGPWWAVAYGAAVIAGSLLPSTSIQVLPVALTAWATCLVLVVREQPIPWRSLLARGRISVQAAEHAG